MPAMPQTDKLSLSQVSTAVSTAVALLACLAAAPVGLAKTNIQDPQPHSQNNASWETAKINPAPTSTFDRDFLLRFPTEGNSQSVRVDGVWQAIPWNKLPVMLKNSKLESLKGLVYSDISTAERIMRREIKLDASSAQRKEFLEAKQKELTDLFAKYPGKLADGTVVVIDVIERPAPVKPVPSPGGEKSKEFEQSLRNYELEKAYYAKTKYVVIGNFQSHSSIAMSAAEKKLLKLIALDCTQKTNELRNPSKKLSSEDDAHKNKMQSELSRLRWDVLREYHGPSEAAG